MINNLELKILVCCECHEDFVFTVDAQEYFINLGIKAEPKLCKSCYDSVKKELRMQVA